MKKLCFIFVLFLPTLGFSQELVAGKVYRTKVDLIVGDTIAQAMSGNGRSVGANTKFEVLDNSLADVYVVRMRRLYGYSELKPIATRTNKDYKTMHPSDVVEDKIYYLAKKVGDQNLIAVETVVRKSYSSIVSGPMVVPFKYRTGDKSISGEAMIGYYAGLGWDLLDTGVGFTPYIAGGLSQINVITGTSTTATQETKTGVTLAVGVIIQGWDTVNIGIAFGQDRIGDQQWVHEGKTWASFSVGLAVE